jgi:hypothetical protein
MTPADASLSAIEVQALGTIAGTMVPADAGVGMPGADDPDILADIVKSVGRDLPLVQVALTAIGEMAGGRFASLDRDGREALINGYQATGCAAAFALGRVILAAYYRDNRVLTALKHEARAPFPKGYAVEQGDWSLLDAVRGRPPLWREDRVEGKR